MERMRGLHPAVLESDEGREMARLYAGLEAGLKAHEARAMAEWCAESGAVTEVLLRQPLLRLEPAAHAAPGAASASGIAAGSAAGAAAAAAGEGAEAGAETVAAAAAAPAEAVCRVNFDPAVVLLLREVHNLLMLPALSAPIPEAALKVGWRRSESPPPHLPCGLVDGREGACLALARPCN